MASWTCGIDFGTCFTTVACRPDDGAPRLVELEREGRVDERFQLPSVVFVDGTRALVGRLAEQRGRERPGRLVRSPKLRLGTGYDEDQDGLWDVVDEEVDLVVPVPELCGAIIAEAYRRACECEGSEPRRVRLTYPAGWSSAAQRERAVRRALECAGLADAELVTEPDAAARALLLLEDSEPPPEGATAVVYDLGGGSCDIAVLRAGASGPVELRARGTDEVGGAEFDRRLMAHVVAAVAAEHPGAHGLTPEPGRLQEPAWRVAAHKLLEDVVLAKHLLSSGEEAFVLVSWPDGDEGGRGEVALTRGTLDGHVSEPLAKTVQLLLEGLSTAGVEPRDVHTTYLTGGSSRIPRVASMLREVVGGRVQPAERPKDVVAVGATLDWPRNEKGLDCGVSYQPNESPFALREGPAPGKEVRRWRS
jgi:molecular chaperone DnaK